MKRFWTLALIFTLLLTAAGAEEKKYTLPLDLSPGMPLVKANYLTDEHYLDPTIEMVSRQVRDGEVLYWVAEVTIQDPTQLRTMPANSFSYSSTASGSKISRRANAVLSCNGDYWWRDVKWKGNYVLRQGTLYMYELTGHSDILLIDEEGDFHIIHKAMEGDVPLPDESGKVMYEGKQIYNGLCFGPALVEEGKSLEIEPDEHMITDQKTGRMALCQMGKLKYAVVTCYNQSMNLQEFADLLAVLGAQTAYNLDGGNSSMMFTGSRMINRNNSVRDIGDIIYFASAWPGEE